MELKKHTVYQALHEQHQILGCDRELTLLLCLICFALGFCSASVKTAVLCLLIFAAGFYLLRLMGRNDLLLRQVFVRQLHYKDWYCAQAQLGDKGGKHYE